MEAERRAEPMLEDRRRKDAIQRQADEQERQRAQKAEERRFLARIESGAIGEPEPQVGANGERYWAAVHGE